MQMHILSSWHFRSFFIHFKLIISLLSHTFITSSLQDNSFNCILRQQTAHDTLLTKPCSPSERCICGRRFSFDSQIPSVRSRGHLRRSQDKFLQGPRFCSPQRYWVMRLIGSDDPFPRVRSSNFFWRRDCLSYLSQVQAQKAQWKGSRTWNANGGILPIYPRSHTWHLWILMRNRKRLKSR